MAGSELWQKQAVEIRELLSAGQITPVDLLEAVSKRIEQVNPVVNALPTLCFDRAMERAKAMQAGQSTATPVDAIGALAGIPVAIKDMNPVAGVRTTFGSPLYAEYVPTESDALVQRVEAAGGIVYAKSNTPEWAAGAQTFNEVFGVTANPWNTALTCGGSSGGSAVALATGMAWLATGSDLGGSLRIPAAFCGVVGLRPSLGRVPIGPQVDPFQTLSVEGPMARSVQDLGLLLDALSGPISADPLAGHRPDGMGFLDAARRPSAPLRVAFAPDLGCGPITAEIREVCAAAARQFETLGSRVEETAPDLSEAGPCFQVLRALYLAGVMAPVFDKHKDRLKPELIWNVEKGLALSAEEIIGAQRMRGRMVARMARFFERFDLLVTPTTAVLPFPKEQRYVEAIDGVALETYVDWLAPTFAITLTGCPALSLPCGFSPDGLPVGLQIIAPPQGERDLLSAAAALETIVARKPVETPVICPVDPISI